jgi:hypothetical protein
LAAHTLARHWVDWSEKYSVLAWEELSVKWRHMSKWHWHSGMWAGMWREANRHYQAVPCTCLETAKDFWRRVYRISW